MPSRLASGARLSNGVGIRNRDDAMGDLAIEHRGQKIRVQPWILCGVNGLPDSSAAFSGSAAMIWVSGRATRSTSPTAGQRAARAPAADEIVPAACPAKSLRISGAVVLR